MACDEGGSWATRSQGLLGDGRSSARDRAAEPRRLRVLTFGVQVAEVAVDVETGEVRVERIAAVHDVGRVINPLGASSQVEGGIIQGLGHTLSEQRLLDPETGVVLTQTLDAYKLPTIADVRRSSRAARHPDEHLNSLGSKGSASRTSSRRQRRRNAIRDATGADVRSLPITREEICGAQEARERAYAHEAG